MIFINQTHLAAILLAREYLAKLAKITRAANFEKKKVSKMADLAPAQHSQLRVKLVYQH